VITVCQGIADSLDNGDRIDTIVIDVSKAFDLVPHGRLLMKIAISGVDSRLFAWVREFFLGRTQRVKVEGQLSMESRVPQGSVLGPLLFLAYVNDIWRNTESNIRLFADDCVIYKNQLIMRTLESCKKIWTGLESGRLKNINPSKCKAVCFTRARVKDPLNYTLGD
jgi:hypothetical protein